MEIVLVNPDIPQNTGNIARTCKATGSTLTLVKPLGFSVTDRALKRAGLDYWSDLTIQYIDDLPSHLESQNKPFYFFSSHAKRSYTEADLSKDCILIFGSETKGLPKEYFSRWDPHFLTIPMAPEARCLNLSNSVAIALYEALRQQNFAFQSVQKCNA